MAAKRRLNGGGRSENARLSVFCGMTQRMRIGIYNESTRGSTGLGGSEYVAAVLAEHLGGGHDAELVHHHASLTADQIRRQFAISPSSFRLRYVPVEPTPHSSNPWRRHLQERRWHHNLSEPYELFINIGHFLPPFCRARRGVLIILFPFQQIPTYGSREPGRAGVTSALWTIPRDAYLRRTAKNRLRTYDIKVSISEFTRLWTSKRWNIETKVLYPPCDLVSSTLNKENLIVSLGRFASRGVRKNQRELIETFARICTRDSPRCRYVSIGALGPHPADHEYLRELELAATDLPVEIACNIDRSAVRDILGRAKIFWHATGFGTGPTDDPAMAEHFGIATVEAMSAGCVPIVIKKGAQPEIIRHGIDGFLWDTLDELQSYTRMLLADDLLRARMAASARERSDLFSKSRFIARFHDVASAVLS